jgi:hypothetical protein
VRSFALFLAPLLLMATATPAYSATDAASLCHTAKKLAILRVNQIKPGGSVAGLRKAIADHAAWYRSHGYDSDRIEWGHFIEIDPKTQLPRIAPDKIITLHFGVSTVPPEKRDAGWQAFVAEYDANSLAITTTLSCMDE